MTSQLEKEVAHYQVWRDQMISGIESYKGWLDTNGYADIQYAVCASPDKFPRIAALMRSAPRLSFFFGIGMTINLKWTRQQAQR